MMTSGRHGSRRSTDNADLHFRRSDVMYFARSGEIGRSPCLEDHSSSMTEYHP